MPSDAKPLRQVIGENFRARRLELGQRQDEIAAEARAFGLPWTRATIAAIETGRREVSRDEEVVVPWLIGVEFPALVPEEAMIQVTPTKCAPGWLVRASLEGRALSQPLSAWGEPSMESPDLSEVLMARVVESRQLGRLWPDTEEADLLAASNDAGGEVETRAAGRLGVHPVALALAARRRWQRSLTEERDRRAPEGQASRGHITRALLEELRPDLEAAGLLAKGH